jgi:predicted ATPase
MHQIRRDVGSTQALSETAIALCNEQGFALWRSMSLVFHGWTLAEQGQAQQGIAQIREGLDNWEETGSKAQLSYLLALLAEAYAKADQTELGLASVAEALDFIDRSNERFYEAELYRLKGQLMRSPTIGDQAEAEACFHQALDSARYHHAKFLELRAATSLARLWQSQGRDQDAYELLAPVYEWFTEGFDTADLLKAKTLLAELSI